MDEQNTQASWQSRSVQLAAVAVVANLAKGAFPALNLDVSVQGYIVDLLPVAVAGVMSAALWFRVKARKIIDRWF